MNVGKRSSSRGFTLVELLIVIVVIGILAAITIVAYNGVTAKAHTAALQSDLSQTLQQVAVYNTENSAFPTDLSTAGIKADPNVTYAYAAGSTAYCVSATGWGQTYYVTSDNSQATITPCAGYAADDFNRTNSTDLGSTELGNTAWQRAESDPANWTITSSGLQVTNSQTNNSGVGLYTGVTDGTLTYTVVAPSLHGGGSGALLRFNGTAGYEFVGDATYGYEFATIVLSPYSWHQIGIPGPTAAHAGDVVKIVLKGSVMTAYVNGVEEATITNSTYTGDGFGFWANDNSTIQFDNFMFAPN